MKLVKELGGLNILSLNIFSMLYQLPYDKENTDIVYGTGQQFGNPMGFGGPYAAFLSTKMKYIRQTPGRLVGKSKDRHG